MTNERIPMWNIFRNPIFIKCARARLRWKQLIAWSIIMLTTTSFVFLAVFLNVVERGKSTELAAKGAFVPILVLQSIVMMFLGTSRVAAGMAQEKHSGTLNFQRLTPMSPISKIFGYLFGLPIREYVLFALTLPFMAVIVVYGKISLLKVLHFYGVFFSTVMLYHMFGMVSGMITPKVRWSSRLSNFAAVFFVVSLYIFMPMLNRFGFTFLGFVTIFPTFYGIVMEELTQHRTGIARQKMIEELQRWQDVQFFSQPIHPTTYTLLIQGLLLLTCFVIMVRKWRQQHNHAFSKTYSLGLFAAFQLLLMGSLWPFLTQVRVFNRFLKQIGRLSPETYGMSMFYIFFFLSGVMAFLLVHVVTPEWFTYIKGLRRAKKLGHSRILPRSDASSNLFYGLSFIVMTWVSFWVLMKLSASDGKIFLDMPPLSARVGLCCMFGTLIFAIMVLRELFGSKGFFFSLFVLWVVPFFVAVIVTSAWKQSILGSYILTLTPVTSFFFGVMNLKVPSGLLLPSKNNIRELLPHLPYLMWTSVAVYGAIGVAGMVMLFGKKARVKQQEEKRAERRKGA
ncbi:MAG TPA: hypothetical protein DCE42_02080 [Myxococcales bacterium]|nr:hypothetical protein [Deltaproteobacteria bacterium]MBU47368.1 hypothetical protein [Deltaproteobacteria bacterium]HAA53512.1 hypothetical protein [Myxococcales bacterium]